MATRTAADGTQKELSYRKRLIEIANAINSAGSIQDILVDIKDKMLDLVDADAGVGAAGAFVPQPERVRRRVEAVVIRGKPQMLRPQQGPRLPGQPPLIVHHRAGELGVVRPRPTVEVVGAARHPRVVDDADLCVDIDRRAGWVVQVEDTEAAATGFAQ